MADPFFVPDEPSPRAALARQDPFFMPEQPQQAPDPGPQPPPTTSVADSAVVGAAHGATLGPLGEWLISHSPQMVSPVTGMPYGGQQVDPRWGTAGQPQAIEDRRKELSDFVDARRQSHPVVFGLSEAAGGALPAAAVGAPASAAGRILVAGAEGGGMGAAAAGNATQDDPKSMLKGGAVGGVLGAGTQGILGEALFPALASKWRGRANDIELQDLGITRQQMRNMKKGVSLDDYESRLDEMRRVMDDLGIHGHKGLARAEAAKTDAGNTIAGFYRQADASGKPGMTIQELADAADRAAQSSKSAMGDRSYARVDDEVNKLMDFLAAGGKHEDIHGWANDIRPRVFPQNGAMPDPTVDRRMMMGFRGDVVDALRKNALANNPGGPITPEAFQQAIANYKPLSDITRAASQGVTREDSGHSWWSSLGQYAGPALPGASLLGAGYVTGHGTAGLTAGLASAAGAWASRSPTLLRTGAGLSSAAGNLAFPGLLSTVDQVAAAAKDYTAGGPKAADYAPASPAKDR